MGDTGRPVIGDLAALPRIKFFKEAVPEILDGRKTLEARARSEGWINKLELASHAALTSGPRFGQPTTFAVARILDVDRRPFDTASVEDLQQLGGDWASRTVELFVEEYTAWFARELERGYQVAWIRFEVAEQ